MAVMMVVAIGAKCRHRNFKVNETRWAVNQRFGEKDLGDGDPIEVAPRTLAPV